MAKMGEMGETALMDERGKMVLLVEMVGMDVMA